MADILDDSDWDIDDDELVESEVTEEVTGGAPVEFGTEDEELDDEELDDELTEDEILRRAMLDDLEEQEGSGIEE